MKERLRTNEGSPEQDTSIHTEDKSPASEPSRCLLPDQVGVDCREHRATGAMGLLVLAQRLERRGLQRRDELDELARVERVQALGRLRGRRRRLRAPDVVRAPQEVLDLAFVAVGGAAPAQQRVQALM